MVDTWAKMECNHSGMAFRKRDHVLDVHRAECGAGLLLVPLPLAISAQSKAVSGYAVDQWVPERVDAYRVSGWLEKLLDAL